MGLREGSDSAASKKMSSESEAEDEEERESEAEETVEVEVEVEVEEDEDEDDEDEMALCRLRRCLERCEEDAVDDDDVVVVVDDVCGGGVGDRGWAKVFEMAEPSICPARRRENTAVYCALASAHSPRGRGKAA